MYELNENDLCTTFEIRFWNLQFGLWRYGVRVGRNYPEYFFSDFYNMLVPWIEVDQSAGIFFTFLIFFHNVKYCSLNVLEFCYIIHRPCLLDYLYHSYISCNLHTYNTTKKKREKLKNKLKNILNNKRRKKGRE